MTLDELRNKNTIDTTGGKIEKPIEGTASAPLAESDPVFQHSGQDYRGGRLTNSNPNNSPIEDTTKQSVNEGPRLKVVQAKFDESTAKKFDINTLEKRPAPPNKYEQDMMADLDRAVEEEKKSISQRIKAVYDKQYEEALNGMTREDVGRIVQNSKDGETDGDYDSLLEGKYEGDYKPEPTEQSSVDEIMPKKYIIPDEKPSEVEEDQDEEVKIKGEIQEDTENVDNTVRTIRHEPPASSDDEDDEDLGDYASDFDFADSDDESSNSSSDNSNSNSIDSDLDADLENESGPDNDEIFEEFKKEIKSKVTPIKNKINLANFSINDNKVSPSTIHMTISDISVADYALPNAKRIVTCSALSGPEMLRMNPQNSTRNRINTLREIYNIIYHHIESKKPSTFDEWLKVTRWSDLDHIYFCLYKATFAGSSFMNYECPNNKCRHAFIEDKNFDDYIVYDNEDIKAEMDKILRSGDDSISSNDIVMQQISDDYVVGLRNPSIWNVVMETATLSNEFLDKYEELIDVISYIDSVFIINRKFMTLDPIDLKPDPKNIAKSNARRIKILADVLRTLPSDNYYDLRYQITTSFPAVTGIRYRIPDAVCPKCGTKIEGINIEAQQLLFMRHQLGAFAAL